MELLLNILALVSGIVIGYNIFMWRLPSFWKKVHFGVSDEEIKMVLVVRKDLKMGAGKVAAQCAHAAVASVEMLSSLREKSHEGIECCGSASESRSSSSSLWHDWFCLWRYSGYSKVVLQCPGENDLITIARKSKEASLPFYVVRDAGRTQVAAGSKTVLAVGPAPKSVVDSITGHLKLY